MNTAIQETGIRELSLAETEMVAGGLDVYEAGGMIAGLALYSASTAGFGLPIAISLIGMGLYKSWKKTNSV